VEPVLPSASASLATALRKVRPNSELSVSSQQGFVPRKRGRSDGGKPQIAETADQQCGSAPSSGSKEEVVPSVVPLGFKGVPFDKLYTLELCAGSAGLTAQLRRYGFESTAVDHKHNRHKSLAPVVQLDLSLDSSQVIIREVIRSGRLVYIHVAPPCGTATKARERPVPQKLRHMGAPNPQPLRSGSHPEGLPGLCGLDRSKVEQANKLYKFVAELRRECLLRHIGFSVENPASSYLWELPEFRALLACKEVRAVEFHQCMHGGSRNALRRWMTNMPLLWPLEVFCDKSHVRKPWGARCRYGEWDFATSDEAQYPEVLCQRVAAAVAAHALAAGAIPMVPSPAADHAAALLGAQEVDRTKLLGRHRAAATGKRPRGRLLPQVIPEFKRILEVEVTDEHVWGLLLALSVSSKKIVPASLEVLWPGLEAGSKLLGLTPVSERGDGGVQAGCGGGVRLGVFRSKLEFLEVAKE
jgi:hypothetical protein